MILGFDIGGTKIRGALVDKGKVVKDVEISTEAHNGPEHVVKKVAAMIEQLTDDNKFPVGIGFPTPLLYQESKVAFESNMPGWAGINIKIIFEKGLKRKVVVDNDANCFTLGEFNYGAGYGKKNVLGITLGTGLGGGIIIDGKLYHGSQGTGAEFGFMCLGDHTFEELCSTKSLYDAKYMAELAMQGDKDAKDAFKEFGENLGLGLANLINIFNPDVIVIGGNISKAWNLFIKYAEKVVNEKALKTAAKHVKILKSELNEDAGVIGAASLVDHILG